MPLENNEGQAVREGVNWGERGFFRMLSDPARGREAARRKKQCAEGKKGFSPFFTVLDSIRQCSRLQGVAVAARPFSTGRLELGGMVLEKRKMLKMF